MNLIPNKQLLLNVPFESTKFRKKDICVESNVQETVGGVYCPTCRVENLFIFQLIKRLVSTTVESAKPAATF